MVPLHANTPEDDVAELTRTPLRHAAVTRLAVVHGRRRRGQANFRTCATAASPGSRWPNVGVDRMMRRAGHDAIQMTLGFEKRAEGLTGDQVEQYALLPAASASQARLRSRTEPAEPNALVFPSDSLRRGRDSNPRSGFSPTPA